jgi:hypothetical protein
MTGGARQRQFRCLNSLDLRGFGLIWRRRPVLSVPTATPSRPHEFG